MPERNGINPVWAPLVAAIAVIGLVIIGYKMLQTQRHVEAVQTELESTNARASELEKHAARLSSEREDAVRQRNDIQDNLMRRLRKGTNFGTSWTNRPPQFRNCKSNLSWLNPLLMTRSPV